MQEEKLSDDIKNIVKKWEGKKGSLIMILHDIQNLYGYVPRATSLQLSKYMDVPLARIYEVITFYHFFKLQQPGKHMVQVCMGTACYLKGASDLLHELRDILGVREGETSKDGLFQLEVVRCLGCCGLAPVMKIDEKVYSKVRKDRVADIIAEYEEEQVAK
ncbi:MAG TPA: NAD(P)H-dependent oxidoreductase subunit E [Candidatus Omnitrophota bacterium]|nr:NAD(P)H-dependent oxidoreductase subunit E [Candidatus Omnitrophota bacterium]MDD5270601.1 NAD(P)H-dependent oxidoreductase subunit E [Candidatus Omnitrophota bacterium]MDD5736924.1 NAD(P)H-dependent oxidoreductase subunit E [Candidatus Omnitrophota bacterium]HOX09706.1 NAD(P)H-dependent oxidoreductase subunit E [Candidatus Omnitrophota bacterium]